MYNDLSQEQLLTLDHRSSQPRFGQTSINALHLQQSDIRGDQVQRQTPIMFYQTNSGATYGQDYPTFHRNRLLIEEQFKERGNAWFNTSMGHHNKSLGDFETKSQEEENSDGEVKSGILQIGAEGLRRKRRKKRNRGRSDQEVNFRISYP